MDGDDETMSELMEKPLEQKERERESARACAGGGEAPPHAQHKLFQEGNGNASRNAREKKKFANGAHNLRSHIWPDGRKCRSRCVAGARTGGRGPPGES
jgi:hypothetical protein